MLRIHCPWCGARDEDEFSYGGPAQRRRPADPAQASDAAWAEHLFTRDNARGVALERWRHTFGCRQWLLCERNTQSHEITRVEPLAAAGVRPAA